jgi:hypothetical protein
MSDELLDTIKKIKVSMPHSKLMYQFVWECVASVLLGKCLAMLKYKGNADMQDRLIENFINDAKRLADTAQIVKEH